MTLRTSNPYLGKLIKTRQQFLNLFETTTRKFLTSSSVEVGEALATDSRQTKQIKTTGVKRQAVALATRQNYLALETVHSKAFVGW